MDMSSMSLSRPLQKAALRCEEVAPGDEEKGRSIELPLAPEGRLRLGLILQVLIELRHSHRASLSNRAPSQLTHAIPSNDLCAPWRTSMSTAIRWEHTQCAKSALFPPLPLSRKQRASLSNVHVERSSVEEFGSLGPPAPMSCGVVCGRSQSFSQPVTAPKADQMFDSDRHNQHPA